jgi:hypothetical protein
MTNRLLLLTLSCLAVWAQFGLSLAQTQPTTPTVTVVGNVGDQIGADLTVDVANPNAFGVDLVFVDCLGKHPDKKLVYGPAWVLFKDIAANGKATGKVDLILANISDVLKAEPDTKAFPAPAEVTCQVRSFETPVGYSPIYKYKVPALTATNP